MNKKISIGFAGFRHSHIFSLYNLAKASTYVNVAGAFEESDEAREYAASNFGIEFTHQSYFDMLEDKGINAIAIGDYFAARGQMAVAALSAGKHVISDKPLCVTIGELDKIKELSAENGLEVGLMLDMRFSENATAAKSIIQENRIGKVNNIYFGGQHPLLYGKRPSWYFEKDKYGGVINDIAIHGIDLIRYITKLEVKEVLYARCWNAYAHKNPDFKDCAQFMLKLSNGAGVISDVSYAEPDSFGYVMPNYYKFEIWGSEGMVCFGANSDGAELYCNGSKTPQTVKGAKADNNCLENFARRICGEEGEVLTTQEVIDSTMDTLKIQYAAQTD